MGRIEEIKKRWNPNSNPDIAMISAPSDVRYLLSRLQIAEQAINDAIEESKGSDPYETKYMVEILLNALEQLQKEEK
jgi:hypothetical protein